MGENTVLTQQLVSGQGAAVMEQLQDLVEHACRRHVGQQRPELGDRHCRGAVDLEIQLGGESQRAQHPYRILAVAVRRLADRPQQSFLSVGEATDVIDQRIAAMIVVQPVDGEIAAPRVVGPRAEDIIAEQPSAGGSPGRRDFAVLRVGVRTVSRHLDHLAAHAHVRESETAPYQARTAEDLLHLLRARIGGDVVVLGLTIEKQIADATADKLGLKAGLVEAVENGKGAWAEARLGDSMFGRGDDYGVELMGFHSVKRFLDRYVLSAAPRAV